MELKKGKEDALFHWLCRTNGSLSSRNVRSTVSVPFAIFNRTVDSYFCNAAQTWHEWEKPRCINSPETTELWESALLQGASGRREAFRERACLWTEGRRSEVKERCEHHSRRTHGNAGTCFKYTVRRQRACMHVCGMISRTRTHTGEKWNQT